MTKEHIIINGAGLCGTLLAVGLAQRGYEVSLFEKRPDMRQEDLIAGRSINLALSNRGIAALKKVGLDKGIEEICIPMKGRMLHINGESRLSPYSGRSKDYINSISRAKLNIALLNEAEGYDNVTIYFDHTCVKADINRASAHYQISGQEEILEVKGDLLIGTDGAGSIIRKSMMSQTTKLLFNYSQHFLRHGYKELSIKPNADGGFKLEKNALHIWPRGSFMIIALPNMDGSFTVTMFHPYGGPEGFDALDSKEKVELFFKRHFPDLIPHMPHYLEEYFENPVATLGTIKCYPWQAYGKSLIMGDAAHAIVPFYGQGMNASFEDVHVFLEMLDHHTGDWHQFLEDYQDNRQINTDAIADLALDNFYEMSDHVADENFAKKRKLEMQLEQQFDDYYSKYSLVTFREDIDYDTAMKQGRKQDQHLIDLVKEKGLENIDLQSTYTSLKSLTS